LKLLIWRLRICSTACANIVGAHFADLTREQVEQTAGQIFACLDANCKIVLTHVDAAEPAVRASLQQLAGLSNLAAAVRSIERHLASLAQRRSQDQIELERFETNYRAFLERRHGVLVLPDFDVEHRVPVEDLYVEAELEINDLPIRLPDALLENPRLVVKGNPGGDKSTLAGVTTYRLARDPAYVPFIVVLREYGQDYDDRLSVVAHIQRMINLRMQAAPPPGWVESTLLSGRAVVTFDGLDELLDPAKRRDARDAVEQFCVRYPYARVLVTSRVVGYDQAPLTTYEFSTANLGELDDEGVQQYAESWFAIALATLDDEDRQQRLANFLTESETVEEIRRNPLMLSLMCVLYRGSNYIPESRLALYEECAKLLSRSGIDREASKSIWRSAVI